MREIAEQKGTTAAKIKKDVDQGTINNHFKKL